MERLSNNFYLESETLPLISIVICTYNRAGHLNACIDSVLKQTNKQWELIIVDDGSEDNSFEVINKYLLAYPNFRYVKHRNIKQALSRNIGLALCAGEYITFLDSDDTYKENHIQSRLDFMLANPDIDLVQGGVDFPEEVYVDDYYKPGNLINLRECVMCATFFGKRKVFFELNGFDHILYGEDTDFWERAEKIFHVHKLTEPETYVYTRAADSISRKQAAGI